MKTENEVQNKLSFKNVTAGIITLSVFIFFFLGIYSVFSNAFKLPLSTFQGFVSIYVIIGSSAAFTFTLLYLVRVFNRVSSTKKSLLSLLIFFALCLNSYVITSI